MCIGGGGAVIISWNSESQSLIAQLGHVRVSTYQSQESFKHEKDMSGSCQKQWSDRYFGFSLPISEQAETYSKICGLKMGIWRGVRSDAQLISTETRFQKCSQSGKNGSKHPMLSISMAFNVLSCKKVERNTQNSKSLILQCKFGSRAQKWPKIAQKTDH